MTPGRVGVVIVRVWMENARSDGFRARVTTITDIEARRSSSTAVATPDAAMKVVRQFLEDFEPDG